MVGGAVGVLVGIGVGVAVCVGVNTTSVGVPGFAATRLPDCLRTGTASSAATPISEATKVPNAIRINFCKPVIAPPPENSALDYINTLHNIIHQFLHFANRKNG